MYKNQLINCLCLYSRGEDTAINFRTGGGSITGGNRNEQGGGIYPQNPNYLPLHPPMLSPHNPPSSTGSNPNFYPKGGMAIDPNIMGFAGEPFKL